MMETPFALDDAEHVCTLSTDSVNSVDCWGRAVMPLTLTRLGLELLEDERLSAGCVPCRLQPERHRAVYVCPGES